MTIRSAENVPHSPSAIGGISIGVAIPELDGRANRLNDSVNVLGGTDSHRDAVAFISGVLGTLIGADLLNLGKLRELGAPVASIGGAGTFDGSS